MNQGTLTNLPSLINQYLIKYFKAGQLQVGNLDTHLNAYF